MAERLDQLFDEVEAFDGAGEDAAAAGAGLAAASFAAGVGVAVWVSDAEDAEGVPSVAGTVSPVDALSRVEALSPLGDGDLAA